MPLSPCVFSVAAGIAKFMGLVECDTLKANAAIAQSYTHGAGNVW